MLDAPNHSLQILSCDHEFKSFVVIRTDFE